MLLQLMTQANQPIQGGGVDITQPKVTWGNKYFAETNEISNNTLGAGTLGPKFN